MSLLRRDERGTGGMPGGDSQQQPARSMCFSSRCLSRVTFSEVAWDMGLWEQWILRTAGSIGVVFAVLKNSRRRRAASERAERNGIQKTIRHSKVRLLYNNSCEAMIGPAKDDTTRTTRRIDFLLGLSCLSQTGEKQQEHEMGAVVARYYRCGWASAKTNEMD